MVYVCFFKKKDSGEKGYKTLCHEKGIELLSFALKKEKNITFDGQMITTVEKGKPFIKDSGVFFSISHTDGLAVCALDDTVNGIDCEAVRASSERVMKRCFTDMETEYVNNSANPDCSFTMLWTLKECYSKLTGQGVSSDLKQIAFDMTDKKALFDCDCDFYTILVNGEYFVSLTKKGTGRLFVKSSNIEPSEEIKILD